MHSERDGFGSAGHRPSRDLLERFARAIVKPGGKALLIDEHNCERGWVAIKAAIDTSLRSASLTFAVDVHTDILAIDCDVDDEARLEDVRFLVSELVTLGVQPVVLASGRPNHRQIITDIPDPRLHEACAEIARQLGFDVRRTIRPPLAPHRLRTRLGYTPRLLDPLDDPVVALGRLERHRPTPSGPAPTRRSTPRSRAGAGSKTQHESCCGAKRVVATFEVHELGRFSGRWNSHSELDMTIANRAANQGWTKQQLEELFRNRTNCAGAKYRELLATRPITAADYLDRTWKRAQTPSAAAAWVQERWMPAVAGEPGLSRLNRAILWALGQVAVQKSSRRITPGYRAIAYLAYTTLPTLGEHLDVLENEGWFQRSQGPQGAMFALVVPKYAATFTQASGGVGGCWAGVKVGADGGLEIGRLGHLAMEGVLRALDEEQGYSVAEVGRRAQVSASWTGSLLRLLETMGVAERDEAKRWRRLPGWDVEVVDDALGISQRRNARRDVWLIEQKEYREWRDNRADVLATQDAINRERRARGDEGRTYILLESRSYHRTRSKAVDRARRAADLAPLRALAKSARVDKGEPQR